MELPDGYLTGVLHGLQFFRMALLAKPEIRFYDLLTLCEDVVLEQGTLSETRVMEACIQRLMAIIRDRNP